MEPVSSLQVAWSTRSSLNQAVGEVVSAAMRHATSPVLALVFSAGDWDRAALAQALAAELGSLPWGGCTATAVFAGRKVMTEGIALGVLSAPQASVGIGLAGSLSHNPLGAGMAAVARAIDHLPPLASACTCACVSADAGASTSAPPRTHRAVLLFADTFTGSGSAAVRGAVREGGTSVCWAGGGVGGQGRATGRMSLLANGRAFLDRTVALAIDLPAALGSGMGHGFSPLGPSLSVTHVKGELIEQLEYSPALATYESLARSLDAEGDLSTDALFHRYPFGIPQADGGYVLREFVRVTASGALEFVSDVPEGSVVRLMRSTTESLIEGARSAALAARAKLEATPGGALVFDCDARFLTLGADFQREIDAISDALGPDVPLLGCTSYGEVGALGCSFPQFHNKTVHVLALPGEEVGR